jgi:thiol-disulfide isomerase/thioredoxin
MRSRSFLSYLMLSLALVAWLGCNPPASEDDPAVSDPEPSADAGSTSAIEETTSSGPARAASTTAEPSASADGQPEVALTIGDLAPTLAIAQWIKGDPIDTFHQGQVHVVEFWATWCGPCRTSMPHLSQLQDQYGEDVSFIGVSDETKDEIEAFFAEVQDEESGKTWSEVLTYAIALDDANRTTSKSYMQAAKQNGIPTAFIVGKDGRVEWIGHPMQMDEPLAKVVSGDWDRLAARAKFEAQLKVQELSSRIQRALHGAQSSGDWSELRAIVTEAEQLDLPMRVVQSLKFDVALLSSQFAEAQQVADELATTSWDEASQLNALAWNLVTRVPHESQNHEQALRIAQRAYELTDGRDASILDTLARVHYEAGDLQQAVDWQRKAVDLAPEQQDTLNRYEAELAETGEASEATQPDASSESDADHDTERP